MSKYMGTSWFLLRKAHHQSHYCRQLHCLLLLLWTFLLKKRAQRLVIQDSDNQEGLLMRWNLFAAAIAKIAKSVWYLYLIIPFQYMPCYKLMITCLNFLPCCVDNSCYQIGSQNPIHQKSSTCLNYQATRKNRQKIC